MTSTGAARVRSRRRAPLWAYLTALVLVPLLGVGALTWGIARQRTVEAASAARAEAAVHAVALLDAVRSSVEEEVVPALSLAVMDASAGTTSTGRTEVVAAAERQQDQITFDRAQRTTDRALALLPVGQVGAAAADRAADHLEAVRAEVEAAGLDVVDVYVAYLDVTKGLMNAERAAAAAANAEEAPLATAQATRDVELVAALTQRAGQVVPLFLSEQLSGGNPEGYAALSWENAWVDYTSAYRQMEELSQSDLRVAWADGRDSTTFTAVDDVLAAYADGVTSAAMTVDQVLSLVRAHVARSTLLADVLDVAVHDAQALAAADRRAADASRVTALAVGAGLLLLSVAGAFLLGRTVSRSLGLLAGQAEQVSRGSLVDVQVDGPWEVRTVSAALGSAVASLRRIQDQARAVARGDLSNALLDEPLPGPLGEVVHASVRQIVRSVRQREELQSALAHQATHDQLTELPNRGQALRLTAAALSRGQRSGSMTGLLYLDLDGFKAVNDNHGHAVGDEVLRVVATRLRDVVRAGDVVCRLGGDEFVVLVEPVAHEGDLLELAERLITSISEPIGAGGHTVRIGVSVGVAVSRDGIADADVLFAEADTATYRAKRQGRSRAEVFDDVLRAQLAERAELEAAIAAGLTNGEMELHYQPVVDVADDRVSGYEALIRWQRPGHGWVAPDDFIPVAEASSLICDLDRWVLHEATRQLAEWRRVHPAAPDTPEPTMAVNISGRHLADRSVVQDVADVLAASGLPPALLVLEVTETVLVDAPAALDNLAALRALGTSVAIDDFGTGYTSIGQLRHMPVDTLKIDRSFIGSAEPGHEELVALIIRAAHTFGLTVVAEGVEEPAQLVRLLADGCDHAQGYLLHRPLTAADAGALLARVRSTTG
ncbi:putative bifunctional diguanylate cyclase/phosphodiesterase [Modestobacter versicolor]|uniref:Diguanylate cyclase (GGDEF)-like protein n=1 Tax=Modestobacter versicolor TaxID=429133 RepID=A0A323V3Y0_9ACTN|nr:EAL domain-containing protein [Modestobacter versicolor]MBB3675793.1 diguanylate cyclase (GGDEF)-like protein [Modestobacter versicolor]PZA19529.1 GGDEF domain-containing protein [Modestobacter versicolor]